MPAVASRTVGERAMLEDEDVEDVVEEVVVLDVVEVVVVTGLTVRVTGASAFVTAEVTEAESAAVMG